MNRPRPDRSRDPDGKGDGPKRWSQAVMRGSNALDIEPGVFAFDDPRRIALSLKCSAEASARRKAPPYRSAMSVCVEMDETEAGCRFAWA